MQSFLRGVKFSTALLTLGALCQNGAAQVGHRTTHPKFPDGVLVGTYRDTGQAVAVPLSPGISDSDCNKLSITVTLPSGKVVNCRNLTPPPARSRFSYDKAIVDASNLHGIDPAQLKAHLHAESSLNPLAESPGGDKGIAQFDESTAADYGLDFHAKKPSKIDEAYLKKNCQESRRNKKGQLPIWCPNASISAMAQKLRENMDRRVEISVPDAKGRKRYIDVSGLFQNDPNERIRYAASMYNRGSTPINSIREHFRQTGKLPSVYEQCWQTPRLKEVGKNEGDTAAEIARRDKLAKQIGPTAPVDKFNLLTGEIKNRCYVELVIGVCGSKPRGYYAEFSKDFKKDGKKWARA